MANSIINDITVLSPSQKKELERKRREQEEREEAEARRKAKAAMKAKAAARQASEQQREAAKKAAAARQAEADRKEVAKQTKKTLWGLLIVVICALMIITIYYWFHFTGEIVRDENGNITGDAIIGAIIIWGLLGFVSGPILVGLGFAISGCSDKIKAIK